MLKRRDYAFTLQTVAPLHVGNGDWREDLLPPIEENGTARAVPVAAIQRDHQAKPWIPGTTLKGALVRLAKTLALPECAALFGEVKDADQGGNMGAVLVRGASMTKAGGTQGLPYAQDGVYVAARTAIDAGRGTSAANKLFHAEMVAPGATFDLRLRLETRGDIEALHRALVRVLSAFAQAEGVALGADQASGQGRVRLVGPIRVTHWAPDKAGHLQKGKEVPLQVSAAPIPRDALVLKLICDGPYLSRDPAWTAETRRAAEARAPANAATLPHLRALRLDKTPLITGQAVSGALRARLEWLLAEEAVGDDRPVPANHGPIASAAAVTQLQPSERLFGVTGFRGVLEVAISEITAREPVALTSVRIDRFAGGTIDNALFATDADQGVSFKVVLALDPRATAADRAVLDRLVDDIRTNGLQLGHGTSRGYGWFRVEE